MSRTKLSGKNLEKKSPESGGLVFCKQFFFLKNVKKHKQGVDKSRFLWYNLKIEALKLNHWEASNESKWRQT